ncbi:hypothetical protein ACQ4PT_012458 [Festuca glaucescens]
MLKIVECDIKKCARAYIGDTGLLDFVLKSLGNRIIGNYVVHRTMNPVTKVLEYCLEDVSSVLPPAGPGTGVTSPGQGKMRVQFHLMRAQLMRDLVHLYRSVLKEPSQALTTGAFGVIPVVVRMALDIKHFVKDYHEGMAATNSGGIGHVYISLCCTLIMRNGGPKLVSPYETVIVPAHATVGKLKWEVQSLFRDMYLTLRTFTAESILGIGASQEASAVLGLISVGSTIVVKGVVDEQQQQAKDGDLKKEAPAICEGSGDLRERVIDRVCGADDDNGERMSCCNIYEAWQHTRCTGVAEAEDVLHVFLCSRCDNDVVSFPALSC